MKKEMNELKRNIMERIDAMDGEELKRVLDFLDKLTKQKEQEREGD